jgi:hypothetical protein
VPDERDVSVSSRREAQEWRVAASRTAAAVHLDGREAAGAQEEIPDSSRRSKGLVVFTTALARSRSSAESIFQPLTCLSQ